MPTSVVPLDWIAWVLLIGLGIYLTAHNLEGRPFDYARLSGIVAAILGLAFLLLALGRPGGASVGSVALATVIWLITVSLTYFGLRQENRLYEHGRERPPRPRWVEFLARLLTGGR